MSCVSKDIQKQCRIQTQNDSIQPCGCPKMIVSFATPPKTPSWNWCPQIFSGSDTETCTVSCSNAHHDVSDLVNYWVVKNAKSWLSWTEDDFYMKQKQS